MEFISRDFIAIRMQQMFVHIRIHWLEHAEDCMRTLDKIKNTQNRFEIEKRARQRASEVARKKHAQTAMKKTGAIAFNIHLTYSAYQMQHVLQDSSARCKLDDAYDSVYQCM